MNLVLRPEELLGHHDEPKDRSQRVTILPNSSAYLDAVYTVLWLAGVFCPVVCHLKVQEPLRVHIPKQGFVVVCSEVVRKTTEGVAEA